MELKELTRGSEELIGASELESKIKEGKTLRIKHGVDPTTSQLHLGYVVNYRVMRRFQDQGHTVVLLMGDFTGRIGDPTDKLESRQGQTKEALREKAQDIISLATKILDKDKLEIRYNSEWWDKMSLDSFMKLAKGISAVRLWERDMFEKRVKNGKPVWTHEFLYPLLQAQDSVEIESDVTVIGSDQKFNELLARDFQKNANQGPQALLIMPILPGTDGEEKMSQSTGNAIGIDESPEDIYGKIMSMPDKAIIIYFNLLTDVSQSEIDNIKKEMASGDRNPRDVKMRLASEIVTTIYSNDDAKKAEEHFKTIFQNNEIPDEIKEYKVELDENLSITDILVGSELAPSKSEARRLIEQGGIKINDNVVIDLETKTKKGDVIQKGKRHFRKIV
jgi:tyrosyl-tRNA synthetase